MTGEPQCFCADKTKEITAPLICKVFELKYKIENKNITFKFNSQNVKNKNI